MNSTKIFRDRWMKSKKATHGEVTDDGTRRVYYHRTPVVEWTDGAARKDGKVTVTLRSGGYETVTTKRRMNEVSEHYDLGFHVSQADYVWSVTVQTHDGPKTLPFENGMSFEV